MQLPVTSDSIQIPPLSVSVVVPVYRGGAEFRRCLAGLSALSPPAEEIIVAVDGEDDGSGSAAEALGTTVIRLPRRSGPATARNAGARLARGDILFFMDADVVPAPTVIAQARHAFAADAGLAALFGSYDNAPGDPGFLSQYRNLLHHYVHQTGEEHAHTFWTACGAVRREIFFAMGGFDENIDIPAMEDIDLGYRLTGAGHRIRLAKDIQVKHLKRWDALTMLRTDIFQRAIPWTRLLRREGRIRNDLNLRADSRWSAVLAWVGLAALAAGLFQIEAAYVAGAAGAGLLWLNAPLYRFFQRQRGWRFAARVIPWHWLYYLYGSAAFAFVLVAERIKSLPSR
ncbi:glycosyltransferase family 2 protein [Methylomagnum sp.]